MLMPNSTPVADNIEFNIPAASDPGFYTPVPGFNPVTQTWTIQPLTPLPPITNPVTIDGYSQAAPGGVPFRYPSQLPTEDPTIITSSPNSIAAKDGNNAHVRLVVDGSLIDRTAFPVPVGFTIQTSHSMLRGLAIGGFGVGVGVGVDIPSPDNVGDLIQGNYIGPHFVYPVDAATGQALTGLGAEGFVGKGNDQQGIILGSTNATVGGASPQENNVITANGAQGVWIQPGAQGNQVLGNQIGVAGPSTGGLYVQAGNGAEGVLIESTNLVPAPNSLTASSNVIGGAIDGAGNIISANAGDGIHITGSTQYETGSKGIISAPHLGEVTCSARETPAIMATESASTTPGLTKSAARSTSNATSSRQTAARAFGLLVGSTLTSDRPASATSC